MKQIGLLVLVLWSYSGMAQTGTTTSHTIEHDGLTRAYRLYVPALYDGSTALPLVFNLHGYTSNNVEQENYGDFRGIADTANFILVHPNGTIDSWGNRHWNTFGTSTTDDVGFLSVLIDSIAKDNNIDITRVYSTGMSNGGFMSFKLACEQANRFTAVASVTGSMTNPDLAACSLSRPVPAMSIHGTNDGTVPYNGNVNFASIPTVIDFWVNEINADTDPEFIEVPDINTEDNSTVEHYIYRNGDEGSTFEHFKVINGTHTWPGSVFNSPGTNYDINASIEVWRFFSQFSNPDATLSTSLFVQKPAINLTVYPNPSSGNVKIKANQSIQGGAFYDMSGRQVQLIESGGNEVEVNVKEKGVYVFHVLVGDERNIQRVVIH